MKFEMAEPPEGTGDDAVSGLARPTPTNERPGDLRSSEFGTNEPGTKPIGQRMAKAVGGVRTALNRLRAHVIEQDMVEADRIAAGRVESAPGAEFHPHRFTPTPDEEER